MGVKWLISFLFIIQALINGVQLVISQSQHWYEDKHMCRGGDITSNNIIKNRDSALDKLVTVLNNSSSFNGFQHVQAGDNPDEQVTAIGLCPPKSKPLCECCLKNATKYLLWKCPKQNEGVTWDFFPYVNCMVRYSVGRKILSVLDDWAWYNYAGSHHVRTVELEKTMDSFTSKLKEEAAGGDGVQKFASGSVSYDHDEFLLHAAMQCTPDLSKDDCMKCLSKANDGIRSCCVSKTYFEGSYMSSNCYVWYSHISAFLDPPTDVKECEW